jgi:hypothetical protein
MFNGSSFRVAALFVGLTVTPVCARTLTLTFNEYCDQLSGWCTVPDQSGDRYPITGVTTVVFDDTITGARPSLFGLANTVTYGGPLFTSTLTQTLPFPVCTPDTGSASLQTPTRVYPGASSSFFLATNCTGPDGLTYTLDINLTLNAILDPSDLLGDLLSLQTSGQPFNFSERETLLDGSVFFNSGYSPWAFLVSIEPAAQFQVAMPTSESRTLLLSLVPLALFGLKMKHRK